MDLGGISYRHWRNGQLIIPFQTNSNQRTRISVEISLEHFLPNNKKPETSRGRARGRVFIVMANNIRQLTEITAKVLKKGKKYVPISACSSIVQVPNGLFGQCAQSELSSTEIKEN